jgi:SAM-dependent methyltransferase
MYLSRETDFLTDPGVVVEVAPKLCLSTLCRGLPGVTYVGVDLEPAGASLQSDLTNLAIASDAVDLAICFHVLEHIPDDRAAMAELARVIRPGGRVVIQVPLRGETTFEDPTADPADYEALFGQEDHVRWYGMDIVGRLQQAGFEVDAIDMLVALPPELVLRQALAGDDRVLLVGRKP